MMPINAALIWRLHLRAAIGVAISTAHAQEVRWHPVCDVPYVGFEPVAVSSSESGISGLEQGLLMCMRIFLFRNRFPKASTYHAPPCMDVNYPMRADGAWCSFVQHRNAATRPTRTQPPAQRSAQPSVLAAIGMPIRIIVYKVSCHGSGSG